MSDWRSKIHEVEFSIPMKKAATLAAEGSDWSSDRILEAVIGNGEALKVKFSDYYDAYIFTLTLHKDQGKYGGHSFWFPYPEVEKGLKVMSWLRTEVLEDKLKLESVSRRAEAW